MKPEIWVHIVVETSDVCVVRKFPAEVLDRAEGMEILWTHYCVCRMKLGKKQKEQDSDAEIERSQRLIEEVLGPEEIATLKEEE
jgi:hypothetical protein